MHRIDKVLFSHGGLTSEFVKWLNEDLLDADIDDVIAAVNEASHDYLWNDESPLWLRPQNKTRETFRADTYEAGCRTYSGGKDIRKRRHHID